MVMLSGCWFFVGIVMCVCLSGVCVGPCSLGFVFDCACLMCSVSCDVLCNAVCFVMWMVW